MSETTTAPDGAETSPDPGPWGINARTGKPYKRNPAGYHRGPRSGSVPKAQPRNKMGKSSADRQAKLSKTLGIPVGIALGVAQLRKSTPLLADALAMSHAIPPISEAVTDLAEDNDNFARVVDMLTESGPYAALISALIPLAAQLAANHGMLPPPLVSVLGAVPPDVLISQEFEKQGHA